MTLDSRAREWAAVLVLSIVLVLVTLDAILIVSALD